MARRRIAAVVLPQLACELVREQGVIERGPLVVLLGENEGSEEEQDDAAATVAFVCERAHALGLRPGMRVAEAMARASGLTFARLPVRALTERLGMLAEVALEFGHEVEIDGLDTLWIDTSGVAHLFGGEEPMLEQADARFAQLGHRVQLALSDGPRLSAALARFGKYADVARIAAPGMRSVLLELPLAALPLTPEAHAYFGKLGITRIGALARIERKELAARLESFIDKSGSKDARAVSAREVLGWLDGRDERPLIAYRPPEVLSEEISFQDGVESAAQLVFSLRHAVSKLSARLTGRRQATHRIDLSLDYDKPIFRLRAAEGFRSRKHENEALPHMPAIAGEPRAELSIELPAPLSSVDDLFRAIKAKFERFSLAAPAVRLLVQLSRIVDAPQVQLDISRNTTQSPDALPALLSELSAELGVERLGILAVREDHRPERCSELMGLADAEHELRKKRSKPEQLSFFGRVKASEPTRLLSEPMAIGLHASSAPADGRFLAEGRGSRTLFDVGSQLQVGRDRFVVQALRFERRLDGAAWFAQGTVSRDYWRVSLALQDSSTRSQGAARHAGGAQGRELPAEVDAWIFVDRQSGELMLHGYWA